jgi:5-methyltetrahydropteroyltriglutamate--homocysteine methyltransferase
MWAKLEALVEGARLATKELWRKGKKPAPKKRAAQRAAKNVRRRRAT